jgi:hypothetical protein
MADIEAGSSITALAARIRELEAQFVRLPGVGVARAGTDCTDCGSNCTNCRGDRLNDVLLPGEEAGLSGAQLVKRLQTRVKG